MLDVNNSAFSQVLAPQSTIYYEEKNSKLKKKKDFSISRGKTWRYTVIQIQLNT